MSRRVVQFDMDGVLADFSEGYDDFCRRFRIDPPGRHAGWDAKWNQIVWDEIKASLTFWRELKPLVSEQTLDRIAALTEVADVYFVTARPGRQTKWQTEEWINDHMCGIDNPSVIVTAKKAEFAQAVGVTHAIDDKAGNAVAVQYMSRGTKSYLLDTSYNRWDMSVLGTKVIRVPSVEAFLNDVEIA